MTKLVESFLKHKGFIKEKGWTNAPLMPNIIADTIYVVHLDYLKGKVKQETKQYLNEMIKRYRMFNKDFFRAFNETEIDDNVNAMDNFQEFTKNEIEAFKTAVRNLFPGIPSDKKEIIVNLALCKFLAAQACEIWGTIYKTRDEHRDKDMNLEAVYIASREAFSSYTAKALPKDYGVVDLVNDKDIQQSMKRFESRVIDFINEWK